MATYTLFGYAPSSIDLVRGSANLTKNTTFQIEKDFDPSADRVTLTITDDDTTFGGDSGSNERGRDSGQQGTSTGPDGTTSGNFYLEDVRTIIAPSGDPINIYRVEASGELVGWFSDGALEAGVTYQVTQYSNVTTASEPSYDDFDKTAFDPTSRSEITGGESSDSLTSAETGDTYSAKGGDDVVFGGGGSDLIYGGSGADSINGGSGEDQIFGGSGDDFISGGLEISNTSPAINPFSLSPPDLGNDETHTDTITLSDGTSSTELTVNYRTGAFGSLDPIANGETTRQNDFEIRRGDSDTEPAFSMKFATAVSNLAFEVNDIDAGSWDDEVRIEAFDADGNRIPISMATTARHHTVEQDGSSGIVEVQGGSSVNNAVGGAGSGAGISIDIPGPVAELNLFYYPGPESSFTGHIGLNDFTFGAIDDGPDAGDNLFGGTGNDTVLGGAGNDTIEGGSGDDSIVGGTGDDIIYGGDNSGTPNLVPSGGNLLENGELEAGLGTSVNAMNAVVDGWTNDQGGIEAWGAGLNGKTSTDGGNFVELDRNAGQIDNLYQDVSTQQGQQYVFSFLAMQRDGNDSIEVRWGGELIDTVTPSSGSEWTEFTFTLTGSGGEDRLEFRELAHEDNSLGPFLDQVRLEALSPAAGPGDVADGGLGDDLVYGGSGNDNLKGDAGNDQIFGGSGNDAVSGGDGSDTLTGGAGNDSISGDAGNDTFDGGDGDDRMSGGSGSDIFVLTEGGGDDSVTDFTVGEDLVDTDLLKDSGGSQVTADEVAVTEVPGQPQVLIFPSGETLTLPEGTVDTSSQQAQFASLVAIGVPPCFSPGTMIRTPDGAVPVEKLRVGDLVQTADHGPQFLRWIGRRTETFETRDDNHRPVLFGANSLGKARPARDLVVSPQHRMVLDWPEVAELHGRAEVLALAKGLTNLPGVRIMRGVSEVVYYALLFDRHEVIYANEAPTESFRPGPVAMQSFSPDVRRQIYAIYPGLHDDPDRALGPPARSIVTRKEARELVAAHRATKPHVQKKAEILAWDRDLAAEKKAFSKATQSEGAA